MTASGPGNPNAGTYTPGSPNTWNVGNLPAGDDRNLTLTATAPNCACFLDVTTSAFSDPAVADPNPANNSADAHILVLSPATIDVFTKTVAGQFIPGGTVTYTVTIHNNGPQAQQDEAGDEFTDTLPGTLAPVSATTTAARAPSAPAATPSPGTAPSPMAARSPSPSSPPSASA